MSLDLSFNVLVLCGLLKLLRFPHEFRGLVALIGLRANFEDASMLGDCVSEFKDRLRELVDERRSANSFATQVGISQSLLRQYLAGGNPGLDKLVKISAATGASIKWLATGEGPRDSATEVLHVQEGTQPEHGNAGMLQIVDPQALAEGAYVILPRLDVSAAAGEGTFNDDEEIKDFVAFNRRYLRSIGVNPVRADMIKVEGRSMVPSFLDGEYVIVDRSNTTIVDDAVYAVVYGEALLLKRLRKESDGTVTLVSDNKAEGYSDRAIRPENMGELRVVGRVRRHIRSL